MDKELVLDKVIEQLNCSICVDKFKDPKLLSCLHSFCLVCLEKISTKNIITCPTCKKETDIPNSKISDLPTDFVNTSILNAIAILEKRECDACPDEEAEQASSRCNDCLQFLCNFHTTSHQKSKNTKLHKLTSLKDANSKNNSLVPIHSTYYCNLHVEEKLILFCDTCSKLACPHCILVVHREHKFQFVKDMATAVKQNIIQNLAKVNEKAAQIEQFINNIDLMLPTVNTRLKTVTTEITEYVDNIILLLEKKKDLINRRGKTSTTTKKRKISSTKRKINNNTKGFKKL